MSIAGYDFGNIKCNMNDSELLSAFLAKAKIEQKKLFSKYWTKKTDAQKHTNFSNKILNYIHIIPCQKLFLLAWYNNITYTLNKEIGTSKTLLTSYYNGPSCQNIELEFLHRELFIDNLPIKYIKTNWE